MYSREREREREGGREGKRENIIHVYLTITNQCDNIVSINCETFTVSDSMGSAKMKNFTQY